MTINNIMTFIATKPSSECSRQWSQTLAYKKYIQGKKMKKYIIFIASISVLLLSGCSSKYQPYTDLSNDVTIYKMSKDTALDTTYQAITEQFPDQEILKKRNKLGFVTTEILLVDHQTYSIVLVPLEGTKINDGQKVNGFSYRTYSEGTLFHGPSSTKSLLQKATKLFEATGTGIKVENAKKIRYIKKNKKEIKERGISTGTGFFISSNGYLLTNEHVISGAKNIFVHMNKEKLKATLISSDKINDIALLKIDKKVDPLPIFSKKKIKTGSDIIIVGYPNIGLQGNEKKANFGYINASSGIQGDRRYFQFSAPIQAGNSGSPLFNNEGEVIGIVTSTLSQSAALKTTGTLAQNVNYAIKIQYAIPLLIEEDINLLEDTNNLILSKTDLFEKVENSIILIISE